MAGFAKVSGDLGLLASTSHADVIVQYKITPTARHRRRVQELGGEEKHRFDFIKAAHYRISARAIAKLAEDPDVLSITPDYKVAGTLEYARPAVGANIAFQYGYDGSGIGVAIIDSGITENDDLMNAEGKSRVVYSEDFSVAGPSSMPDPLDHYGHGTHVAGIAGGSGANSTGNHYTKTFVGIAPNANLINLKVLGGDGSGNDSAVIAAISRAIQLKATYNIRVLNVSLGRPVYQSYRVDPLCQAVEQAYKAGITVVVAAGNEGRNNSFGNNGYGTISAPGNDPFVITVGAMKDVGTVTTADDTIASNSSKGPTLLDHVVKPDLVAPGNRMISVLADGSNTLIATFPANGIARDYYTDGTLTRTSKTYVRLSGTSMAAPMVSGAAALLLQKDPTLTPDQIKARLMLTAGKVFPRYSTVTDTASGMVYTSQYDIFTVGAGYLNVWAALNNTEKSKGTAGSPSVMFNSAGHATILKYTVLGNSAVWGDQAVWGDKALWGSTAVWGDQAVWGDSVLFTSAASNVAGSTAVWGDQAVWGDGTTKAFSALWGSTAVWGDRTLIGTESLNITGNGEN